MTEKRIAIRISGSTYDKAVKRAKKLGFVTFEGKANISAYARALIAMDTMETKK